MVVFHNTFLNLLKAIMSEMHLLNLIQKVPHLEFPRSENVSD